MSTILPRPYQTACVNAIWQYFASGNTGNPLVALPTGTGKSLIPPLFMKQALQQYPFQRMMLLTHVKELIEQNHKSLLQLWPSAPVGIFSAGLSLKEAYAPLVFGGIASVKNSICELGHRDLLFIDEAHLLSPNENSMYQTVIAELKIVNPNLKVIGLSATPFRMGQGMLTDGGIFTDIVYDLTGVGPFNQLIDDCYLSPLIPKKTNSVIDVSDVRQLASDFNQGDLAKAVTHQGITQRAIVETMDLARDRKSWVVFGAGIENCEQLTDRFNAVGVATTVVHSKLTDEQRADRLAAFKAGRFRAIVSNNILTTGFDHPQIDCIVDLRPTTSVVLHVQKYGRGTRPYFHPSFSFDQLRDLDNRKRAIQMGGKLNCIVLDFAGNTNRLGPINDPRIPRKKGKGTGEVPVKLCPHCGAYNHTVARYCCDCGKEFIFRVKIKPTASTEDIIAVPDSKIELLKVNSVSRKIHNKIGSKPSLQVQYLCGMKLYSSYLCFEHTGLAKHRAHEWFRQHSSGEIPKTTREAYNRFSECRVAKQIKVDSTGKYPQIMEWLF